MFIEIFPLVTSACGRQVTVIGSADEALHRGEIDRARIVLDQALDADRLFGGPFELVFGEAQLS
jgi:hypothetical protein